MTELKRQTIGLSEDSFDKLKKLNKHYGINQWQMVDILIRQAEFSDENLAKLAETIKSEVKAEKEKAKKAKEVLKNLSPEDLDKLLKNTG